MAGVAKPGVDWARARELYERSDLSLDEIGAEVGVTRWAIIKRKKAEGWGRPSPQSSEAERSGESFSPAMLPAPSAIRLGSKDTPETRAAVLEAVARGMPLRSAAEFGGISEDTFKRWRDLDADFAGEVIAATQEWHRKRLGNIESAGDRGDWKADAWLLERHPATRELYKAAQNHSGPSITVQIAVARGDAAGQITAVEAKVAA